MKIALLCGDPVYAEALVCLLRHSGGYEVVCCAGHLGGAQALLSLHPDLLIATEEFDDKSHRFLIQNLKASGMKAMMLHGENMQLDDDEVFDFSISRYRGVGAMFELIRKAGESLEESPVSAVVNIRKVRRGVAPGIKFTPREREISELVTKGMSNRQIAQVIGTGEQNVKMYVSRLMRLLNCANRVQVALILQSRETEAAAFD